eukprot:scaffold6007_cov47-Attheya_sp.AAC.2
MSKLGPQLRCLSTHGDIAVHKLQDIFEQYRIENYAQEIPSRFRKEICQAATSRDGQVASDGLFRVINNIGASDRVTKEELETVCDELGDTSPNHTHAMPVNKMMEILQNKI